MRGYRLFPGEKKTRPPRPTPLSIPPGPRTVGRSMARLGWRLGVVGRWGRVLVACSRSTEREKRAGSGRREGSRPRPPFLTRLLSGVTPPRPAPTHARTHALTRYACHQHTCCTTTNLSRRSACAPHRVASAAPSLSQGTRKLPRSSSCANGGHDREGAAAMAARPATGHAQPRPPAQGGGHTDPSHAGGARVADRGLAPALLER